MTMILLFILVVLLILMILMLVKFILDGDIFQIYTIELIIAIPCTSYAMFKIIEKL